MNYRTHMCGGLAMGVGAVSVIGIDKLGVMGMGLLVGSSVIGALLPDIDKKGTYIYNRLPLVGWFAKQTGHRNLFHAPLFYSVIALLLTSVFGFQPIIVGAYLGVLSHLVLDTLNYKGIPWLYPIIKTKYHVARIKAGSSLDSLVGGLCLAYVVWVVCFK